MRCEFAKPREISKPTREFVRRQCDRAVAGEVYPVHPPHVDMNSSIAFTLDFVSNAALQPRSLWLPVVVGRLDGYALGGAMSDSDSRWRGTRHARS